MWKFFFTAEVDVFLGVETKKRLLSGTLVMLGVPGTTSPPTRF